MNDSKTVTYFYLKLVKFPLSEASASVGKIVNHHGKAEIKMKLCFFNCIQESRHMFAPMLSVFE